GGPARFTRESTNRGFFPNAAAAFAYAGDGNQSLRDSNREAKKMENPFAEIELAPDNLSKRLPAILLLDTSGSMGGRPIDALNEGLKVLEEEFDPDTGDSL